METNKRWDGIFRPYFALDVVKLSGSIAIKHTLAKNGAIKLYILGTFDTPYLTAKAL